MKNINLDKTNLKKHIINNLKMVRRQLKKSQIILNSTKSNHLWDNEIIWVEDAINYLEEKNE